MRCSWRFASAILASWLLHLTFGTVYCWGSIAPYIVSYMRSKGHSVDYDQMSWAVSVTTALQSIAMYASGTLHHRLGVRLTCVLGCSLMTLGIFLSSFAVGCGKVPFLLTYSSLFGLGMGLGYITPMLCLMKWLPDQKGMASGLVVAGFGTGACLFNKVQQHLINPDEVLPSLELGGDRYFDWQNSVVNREVLDHVPAALRLQALVFACMQALGVLLLLDPPAQEPRADEDAEADPSAPMIAHVQREYTTSEMVVRRDFWFLMACVVLNAQVVLTMTASQKTFGLELVPGISDNALTNITGAASLLNGFGRLIWGAIADATSFRVAMLCVDVVLVVMLLTLAGCSTQYQYMAWVCLIFFSIGGHFSLYPQAASTFFGSKHLGSNYGVVFMGFAASELTGSAVLEYLLGDKTISTVCSVMAILAGCSGLMALQTTPRRRQPAPSPSDGKLAAEPPKGYGAAGKPALGA